MLGLYCTGYLVKIKSNLKQVQLADHDCISNEGTNVFSYTEIYETLRSKLINIKSSFDFTHPIHVS